MNMENYKKQTTQQRDSSIELFRIITMFMIVAHHYIVNSGVIGEITQANVLSTNSIFSLLWGWGGKTGIDCFVLITGYFMCKSNITVRKFLKLLFEIQFYQVIIYAIFLISGYEKFALKSFVKAIIPIYGIGTGFTASYLAFFCFIPFLNILIKAMDEKQHRNLLITSLIIGSLLQTFLIAPSAFTYVGWFMVVYFIGSYIRLYREDWFSNKKWWTIAAAISLFLSLASVVAGAFVLFKFGKNASYYFVADSNKILAVITSVSLFVFFKNLKFRYNPVINTVAASTFGVFLIHTRGDRMRQWLWKDTLNNVGAFHSDTFIIHAVVSVLAIYIICTLIDIARIHLLEKPLFKILDKKLK